MKNNRSGSLLIAALWMLVITSVLIISLSFRGSMEAKNARASYEQFVSLEQLRSSVIAAMCIIESDYEPLQDTQDDEWYLLEDLSAVSPGEDFDHVQMQIRDEESKLNINLATEEMLAAFFEALKEELDISIDAEDAAAAVMAYQGKTSAFNPDLEKHDKERSIHSVYELSAIKELASIDLHILSQYLTVVPKSGSMITININTASEPVLRGVLGGVVGDDDTKEDLLEGVLSFRESLDEEGERLHFTKKSLTGYKFIDRLGLTREVRLVSIAVQFLRFTTVNSQFFSVTSSSTNILDKVETILGPAGRKEKQAFVSASDTALAVYVWHEI